MPFGKIFKSIGNVGSSVFKGASSVVRGLGGIPGLGNLSNIFNLGNLFPGLPSYMTKLSGIGGSLNSIFGGLSQIGSAFSGEGGDLKNARKQGQVMGAAQRAFMEEAYPGTNPWERLGTGQGGAAGHVQVEGQQLQDRLNRRTLSVQKEIADKNALAQVAPAVLQQHPELAPAITRAISPHVPTVGANLKTALGERRFQLDQRIRSAELAVKQAGVNVQSYKAETGRLMHQLESGKFEFNQAVKQFEAGVKNREVAVATVNALRQMYDSVSATTWKAIKAALEEAPGGSTGLFERLKGAVRDLPSQPVPLPGALRQRTSAPGAGQRVSQ